MSTAVAGTGVYPAVMDGSSLDQAPRPHLLATGRALLRIQMLLRLHREEIELLPIRDARLQPGARWTRYRKARLIQALCVGEMALEPALATFSLSADEVEGWIRASVGGGIEALRAIPAEDSTGEF
jgi:hypothetical protein